MNGAAREVLFREPLSIRAVRAAIFAAGLAFSVVGGCREVPHGGVYSGADRGVEVAPKRRPGTQSVRRITAAELLPADLDLTLRIDLARMRSQLGADAIDRLLARALAEAALTPGALMDVDPLLVLAARRADVVFVGLRAEDPASGDRVVVVEGNLAGLTPESARYRPGPPSAVDAVRTFDRIAALVHAPRDTTARVVTIGERVLAFLSPVEVDSVARVLEMGPDPKRGDPAAEGLISVDVRVRRLAPTLERRFPSLGAVVAGLERVRGSAVMLDDGVRVDLEIQGVSLAGAERLLAFVEALKQGSVESDRTKILASLSAERLDKTVRVRWTVPAPAVLGMLGYADVCPSGRCGPAHGP